MQAEKTKEAVCRIADSMAMNGIEPTIREIRKRIGHGSVSTICAALKEWKMNAYTYFVTRPNRF